MNKWNELISHQHKMCLWQELWPRKYYWFTIRWMQICLTALVPPWAWQTHIWKMRWDSNFRARPRRRDRSIVPSAARCCSWRQIDLVKCLGLQLCRVVPHAPNASTNPTRPFAGQTLGRVESWYFHIGGCFGRHTNLLAVGFDGLVDVICHGCGHSIHWFLGCSKILWFFRFGIIAADFEWGVVIIYWTSLQNWQRNISCTYLW